MMKCPFMTLLFLHCLALPSSQGSHSIMFQDLMKKNFSKRSTAVIHARGKSPLYLSSHIPSTSCSQNHQLWGHNNINSSTRHHLPSKRTICITILQRTKLAGHIDEIMAMDFLNKQKKEKLVRLYDLLLLNDVQKTECVKLLLLEPEMFPASWAMIFDEGKLSASVVMKEELVRSPGYRSHGTPGQHYHYHYNYHNHHHHYLEDSSEPILSII